MDLPVELWKEVFTYLGSESKSRRDLCSACLVSRQFRSIAQPVLYGDIDKPPNKVRLLQTLASRPDLAQHVRDITFDDTTDYIIYPGMRQMAKSIIASLQLPPRLRAHLRATALKYDDDTKCSGIGALLMALTRRIKTAYIEMDSNGGDLLWLISGSRLVEREWAPEEREFEWEDWVEYVDDDQPLDLSSFNLAPAAEPTEDEIAVHGMGAFAHYGLSHLTTLELFITTDHPCEDISIFEPVLLHPTLQKLVMSRTCYSGRDVAEMKLPNEPCHLQTLVIRDSLFDHEGMRNILKRCHSLRCLELEHGVPDGDGGRPSDPFDRAAAGECLRQYGQNLEELVLELSEAEFVGAWSGVEEYEDEYDYEDGDVSFGSLEELKSLKRLVTGGFCMVGRDNFDSSNK